MLQTYDGTLTIIEKFKMIKTSIFSVLIITALMSIFFSCSTNNTNKSDIGNTSSDRIEESTTTPIPTPTVPTQAPTAIPIETVDATSSSLKVKLEEIEVDECSDIPDLTQRSMCEIGEKLGLSMEDMLDMAQDMGMLDDADVEEKHEIVEEQLDSNTISPEIKIINYTDYSISDLENWIYLAESKMKSRRARIFLFIYPVGEMKRPEEPVRSDYADRVFRAHEVLLTQSDIEMILDQVEDWFTGDPCLDSSYIKRNLSDYRSWLENGGDASTMHTVCEETRVVAMGVTKNMRLYEPLDNFKNFLFHEFYHAFQQDLAMEGKCRDTRQQDERNSNSQWLVEGAAHYFATWLVAEINNTSDHESQILELALKEFEREGENIEIDAASNSGIGPDKWGAAALNLMVKQNLITEDSILDGSLFHNCDRELVFNKTNPNMQKINDSWSLIEKVGDTYKFNQEALAN